MTFLIFNRNKIINNIVILLKIANLREPLNGDNRRL